MANQDLTKPKKSLVSMPPITKAFKISLAIAVSWVLVAAGFVYSLSFVKSGTIADVITFFCLLGLGLGLVWALAAGERLSYTEDELAYVVVGSGAIAGFVLYGNKEWIALGLLVLFMAGFWIYPWSRNKMRYGPEAMALKRESLLAEAEAEAVLLKPLYASQKIFGVAGANLENTESKFTEENLATGARGELLGAQAINGIVKHLSGAYVFHSLRYPGSQKADLDHVVVAGSRVVIIDSKLWKRGSYRWSLAGGMLRDDEPFAGGDTAMLDAAAKLEQELQADQKLMALTEENSVKVTSLILLTREPHLESSRVDNKDASDRCRLVTVEGLEQELRSFLFSESTPQNEILLENMRMRMV